VLMDELESFFKGKLKSSDFENYYFLSGLLLYDKIQE